MAAGKYRAYLKKKRRVRFDYSRDYIWESERQ